MRIIYLFLCIILLATSCKTGNSARTTSQPQGKVILIRHADRDDGVDALNQLGQERAAVLADLLSESELDAIYSSQYQRTQQTVQPLCEAKGLAAKIYDAASVGPLVETIKSKHQNQTVLVVGHGNTIPEAINEFGHQPALSNLEHHQYSNLYILNWKGDDAELILLKYGKVIED